MISVHQAAVLLGGSEAWVRSLCLRHIIGDAFNFKTPPYNRPLRLTYRIVPGQLAEYMRISVEELERRVEKMREGRSVYVH